jgi:hypothetical protein
LITVSSSLPRKGFPTIAESSKLCYESSILQKESNAEIQDYSQRSRREVITIEDDTPGEGGHSQNPEEQGNESQKSSSSESSVTAVITSLELIKTRADVTSQRISGYIPMADNPLLIVPLMTRILDILTITASELQSYIHDAHAIVRDLNAEFVFPEGQSPTSAIQTFETKLLEDNQC